MDETIALIDRKMREELDALHVHVIDESHLHRGHKAAGGGGHYRILVVSPRFENVNLLDQRRMVYAALDEAINGTPKLIHALQIKTLTPGEWEAAGRPA